MVPEEKNLDPELSLFLERHRGGRVLLISFEDADIVLRIRRHYPNLSPTVLTKEDFSGKSTSTLLRTLREESFHLTIISDRKSTTPRPDLSIRLLASFLRTRDVIILHHNGAVSTTTRLALILSLVPRLGLGAAVGLGLLLRAWCSLLTWNILLRNQERRAISRMEKLQIAYLRTDLSGSVRAGGSLSHILGFVDGLRALGHSVHYVSDSELTGGGARGVSTTVVPPSRLLEFFDELQLIDYHYRVIREGKKLFQSLKPDLLYHRHSAFNFSSVVLGFLLGIPVVLEANYSEVWTRKRWSRLVLERLAVAFERMAFRHADLVVTVSRQAGEDLIALGAESTRLLVNPNAADPDAFRPAITRAPIADRYTQQGKLIAGFLGTFTRWHGVEILLETITLLKRHNEPIHFLLMGDGNLKPKLEMEVETKGLHDVVTFTGLIPHEEVPRYLAACDILVSPHLGFEDGTRFFGSPTKLYEYMAMGKAIVASNLEQIGEVIHDGVNGLLVKPGDAQDLAEKILRLSKDPDLRRRLGEQARRDVEQNYTWEQNARRVLDALRKQ